MPLSRSAAMMYAYLVEIRVADLVVDALVLYIAHKSHRAMRPPVSG
jgi:hypothetical protein